MAENKRQGLLVLISGPSGAGKGTIVAELLQKRSDCQLSISATTRAPRPGEEDGKSYFFISREEFDRLVEQGRFLEWNEHFGNCYGTPLQFVEEQRSSGNHVILEIDVMGAKTVLEKVPDAIGIFVAPPSLAVLKERLISRGSENEEQIKNRLARVDSEVSFLPNYDFMVTNNDLETAVNEVSTILDVEMLKTERLRRDGVVAEIFGQDI